MERCCNYNMQLLN